MDKKLLEGNLATVLMAILAGGASYGYAIVAEVERRTEGRLRIRQNALYPALHRLEAEGLIAGEWREAQGRRRRYYRLTPRGKKELRRRRAHWREFSATINAALKEVQYAVNG
ncbi:MAG: PadR family transcriptional regulator [Anaerolineae bacterium]|nr:PadR family transcriptional regulator [Anaerolineae bacterium]